MEVTNIQIDKLKPYDKNPRINKGAVDYVVKSIKANGFNQPLVVDQNFVVCVGHTRLMAAKKMSMTEVPCYVKNMSKEQFIAYNLADNKTSEYAEWDDDLLKENMNILNDIDASLLEATAFTDEEIDLLVDDDFLLTKKEKEEKESERDNAVPETGENQFKVKLGDIWQLGNHRIMCGDSTKKENIDKLLNGNKIDMVFTDPPYGMNLDTDFTKMHNSNSKKYKKVIGDDSYFDPSYILEYFSSTKEIFLWGADYYHHSIPESGGWIVWNKRSTSVESRRDFESDLQEKNRSNAFELCWSKVSHKRIIYNCFWNGNLGEGKDEQRTKAATIIRHHPTQKPIKLCHDIIIKYKSDTVCDLFLGSGSTLIACEKTNRTCYGMELDPHYCSVIINRWQDYTGLKAKKL